MNRWYWILSAIVCMVDLPKKCAALLAPSTVRSTAPPVFYGINAEVGTTVGIMPEVWKSLTVWDWHTWLAGPADPAIAQQYPYLSMATFFTATGGCTPAYAPCKGADRDLYSDPLNASSPLNLTNFLQAMGNAMDSGLLPYVVVANVPVALSAKPIIGAFGVNSALPTNMSQYYQYVYDIAVGAVAQYGLSKVRSWRWGVFTEYNNQDWLVATPEQYFQLYDFTACALEDVLGVGQVIIGAHACTQCHTIDPSLHWDALLLLDHVATGSNYCRSGKTGAPMTFITDSFYENAPGNPGNMTGPRGFDAQVTALVSHARALGLGGLEFGIDEGRLLSGDDGLQLTTRAVGWTYQASWDGLFQAYMAYNGVSYYSRWGVNTGGQGGFWGVQQYADNVASNVAKLSHRMAGDPLVPAVLSILDPSGSRLHPDGSLVNATLTYNKGTSTMRLMVVHHHPNATYTGSIVANIGICGFKTQANPSNVLINETRVDDDHGQFFNEWMSDAAANGVTDINPGWSNTSDAFSFGNAAGSTYWASQVARYQQLAGLTTIQVAADYTPDGCLVWTPTIPHHGVALYEASVQA